MTNASERIVFITGATSGIGAACARAFAESGARIVLTGRRADLLAALVRELAPAVVHTAILDVRDRAAVDQVVASLPPDFANVTHLVNNAGLALGTEPAPEANAEEWETMIDTNVKGVVHCTRAILPGFVARDCGHIVNIGSVAGTYPYPGGNVYGATKAFVHQFSLNLRADLIGKNVRVTCVEPGMVESSFSKTRYHGDEAKAAAVYNRMTPMTPQDIADTILFCVDRPPHVNVNSIEMMATMQAFGPFTVHRAPR